MSYGATQSKLQGRLMGIAASPQAAEDQAGASVFRQAFKLRRR
jgi:hypothetical protein